MKTAFVIAGVLTLLAVAPFYAGDDAMSETATKQGAESIATLGGGCFWCLEAAFEELAGVKDVVSGYAGGDDDDPSYEDVCSGSTGHAEVVRITFDPAVISFEDLLDVFFKIHDPTTIDRQGVDVGSQYRSIILAADGDQKCRAERYIKALQDSGVWGAPIVTQVVALGRFHRAEKYHQDYFRNNPTKGYCRLVVAPKVDKVRDAFPDRLKH